MMVKHFGKHDQDGADDKPNNFHDEIYYCELIPVKFDRP